MKKINNYISSGVGHLYSGKNKYQAIILVYHGITNNSKINDSQKDSVNIIDFEKQVKYLSTDSYNIISLRSLMKHINQKLKIPPKTIVITFDDGYKNTYSNAFPILNKYRMPFTVFIATKYVNSKKPFPWIKNFSKDQEKDLIPLSWDEIHALNQQGVEIGSHSESHKFLPNLDMEEINSEIIKSREKLNDHFGEKQIPFALPYSYPLDHKKWVGFKNKIENILKVNNIYCCCTMNRGHVDLSSNIYSLKRLPIIRSDHIETFKHIINGNYIWSYKIHTLYQKHIKKYDY